MQFSHGLQHATMTKSVWNNGEIDKDTYKYGEALGPYNKSGRLHYPGTDELETSYLVHLIITVLYSQRWHTFCVPH